MGHEAQMDRLSSARGMSPLSLRELNALAPGDVLPTGQRIEGSAPVHEVLRLLGGHTLPTTGPSENELARAGGQGRCADPRRVRRGVGIALGFKNIAFSEGYDDPSTA